MKRKSLINNDRDQVLWERESEHPTQNLVFTKTAGTPTRLPLDIVILGLPNKTASKWLKKRRDT